MSDVQIRSKSAPATITSDTFEDGWDKGVDWANERAAYPELWIVQQLYARRCDNLEALVGALGCPATALFGDDTGITARHVEGFIDGAVAILREGGM